MPDFPIRDYRGTTATPRNRAMDAEIQRMRQKGLTLPTHPRRAVESMQQMTNDVRDGSALQAINQTRAGGRGRVARSGGGMTTAIDNQREPLQSMMNKGIPYDTA